MRFTAPDEKQQHTEGCFYLQVFAQWFVSAMNYAPRYPPTNRLVTQDLFVEADLFPSATELPQPQATLTNEALQPDSAVIAPGAGAISGGQSLPYCRERLSTA